MFVSTAPLAGLPLFPGAGAAVVLPGAWAAVILPGCGAAVALPGAGAAVWAEATPKVQAVARAAKIMGAISELRSVFMESF